MTPEAALEAQIERCRHMTGDERLVIALRLHELACAVARDGICAAEPGLGSEEVEARLQERIRMSYEI